MKEKTINILGKDVTLIYCPATENYFEDISHKSIAVFVPTEDADGNKIPAQATIEDLQTLAMAAITAWAAYQKAETGVEPEAPITGSDILFRLSADERNILLGAISEIRNEWYAVGDVVAKQITQESNKMEKGRKRKNP